MNCPFISASLNKVNRANEQLNTVLLEGFTIVSQHLKFSVNGRYDKDYLILKADIQEGS